jgi:ribosome maturation factor RimP
MHCVTRRWSPLLRLQGSGAKARTRRGQPLRGVREEVGGFVRFFFLVGMYRDIPEEMRRLVEPVVESAGYELVDLLVARGRPPWLVRITVDTPQGDGRVPVDRLAELSREIGSNFDAVDAIPASYRLELSSPGLERMLAREVDFARACGSEVRIETRRPLDGQRRFRGVLTAFDGGAARLATQGREVSIPFAEVERANLVYIVGPADFARGAGSR